MENLFVFSEKVKKCKLKSKPFLVMNFDSKGQHTVPSSNTENMKTVVELPKLNLKKFVGGSFRMNQFRETYEAAIRQST